jgi:Arylsulfotransferase (ASST)
MAPIRSKFRPIVLLLAAAILVAIVGLPTSASGRSGAKGRPSEPSVSVFPIAGSRVATPRTQIAFRGIPASELGQITVTGSLSGVHAGTIEADSDGHGGSFLPAKPFTAGETVTVSTSLNIVGAKNGTFRFTIATPAGGLPPTHWPAASRASGDVFAYRSRPDLAPAAVRLTRWSSRDAPGDIFLASQFGPVQDGPEILGPGGGLIWFDPLPGDDSASDFRVQTYHGRPVLTWWQGYMTAGAGVGVDEIYNSSYQPVAVVRAANGLSADLHEFQLTPENTALITAYYPVYWNASSVGGSKHEIVFDCVVQEIDIPTGLVLFHWDSLDHVPLSDSYEPLPKGPRAPFDYFHVNSIQQDDDGNLLISARNTWAAYKVNIQTGAVMWELGGKHSSFKLAPGVGWAFQHDVRARASNDLFVTMFDDGAGPPIEAKQSRAIKLNLDFKNMTARQVAQDLHTPPLLSSFEGNDQQLPNHDDFVGWGQQPYFSEYDPSGRLIYDGRFVDATASYRAYRFPWSGTPTTPPAIAYSGGRTPTVYASWNGATHVSSWRVLAGTTPTKLRPVAAAHRTWFETWIRLPSAQRYVAAQALDSSGHVLGTSNTLATGAR